MGVYKKEPIKDFEDYQIDTNGVVYNKNGTIKKLRKRKDNGYLDTILIDKNKKKHCKRINRLVAIQFIPNPDNLPEVNHKDGNKANNNVDNLEWCTPKYNSEHSIKILKHGKTWILWAVSSTVEPRSHKAIVVGSAPTRPTNSLSPFA